MQFKNLKISTCPECGCSTVVAESVDYFGGKVHTHCNGQQWERRAFLCGASFQWIPNFDRADCQSPCQNTPEWEARESQRLALRNQISDLEEKLRKI